MKFLLGAVLVLFYALFVTAIKGGLSEDEQKKLLDALNKDRLRAQQASNGITFEHLTYDLELEKKAAAFDCKPESYSSGVSIIALQWNSVGDEIYKEIHQGTVPNLGLYDWRQTKIGCSKEVTCRAKIEEGPKVPSKLIGKEFVTVGGCILGPLTTDVTEEDKQKASKLGIPKATKYGDLLGIKISSGEEVKT
ncbi:hypothetical protein GCK72_011644 [Caenorhabditis remanei]|uniref:SCP domain-containing protein n=1 Tax=Caenorhabditis remanei TaxID=31234 RepID=A0A6A5H6K8_CAERE|nr:hypothetical protein GCK72_011644 [Caenorhabditis remanei]KAF1763378.1 hypothetical protein GCK72_011644 [Caenorhabditis remanei]